MLTKLKKVMKALPPFRSLLAQREKLQQTIIRLQADLVQAAGNEKWGPPCYCTDGMCNYGKNMDFMNEDRFVRANRAGQATGGVKNTRGEDIHVEWRIHMIVWAAQHALHLPGDFVECGVNRGFMSVALCDYIRFNDTGKSFFLFDTYQGIPEEQILPSERKGAMEHNEFHFEECYEAAKRNFAPYTRAQLIRGRVPDTLPTVRIDKVCYLSIDMNIAEPEIAALRYFWDKLVPGAVVVLDDYGWAGYYQQKNGLDAFAAEKGVAIATLPTGQGLLLKP